LVGLEVQFWGLLEWVVGVVVGDGFEAELVHGGVVLREFLLEYLIFKESLIVHPTKLALPKLPNYLRPKNIQQLCQTKSLLNDILLQVIINQHDVIFIRSKVCL
jgi:hypothetical protein